MSVLGTIFVSIGVFFGVSSVKAARATATTTTSRDEERRRQRRREAFIYQQRGSRVSSIWQRVNPRGGLRGRANISTPRIPISTDLDQTCVSCQDAISEDAMATLQDEFLRPLNQSPSCNHFWCPECLKSRFEGVLKDRAMWPPSCCDKTPFPDMDVLALNLLPEQYTLFKAKMEEYEAKYPIYCPKKTCSAFIPPPAPPPKERFRRLRNRPKETGSVTCKECKTEVCVQCRQMWHPPNVACTKDEDSQKFDELVEKEMWASCPACNQTIELTQGCNHMVCFCKKEFCYVCKKDWRGTCGCPPWSKVKEQRDAPPTAVIVTPTTTTTATAAAVITITTTTHLSTRDQPLRVTNQSQDSGSEETQLEPRDSIELVRERENREREDQERREELARRQESVRRIAAEIQAREEGLRRELQQRLAREREEREQRERAGREERAAREREREASKMEASKRRKVAEEAEALERQEELERIECEERAKKHAHVPTARGEGADVSQENAESACLHPELWPKVKGRNVCSQCQRWCNRFTLQCPACEIRACVACSVRLKA